MGKNKNSINNLDVNVCYDIITYIGEKHNIDIQNNLNALQYKLDDIDNHLKRSRGFSNVFEKCANVAPLASIRPSDPVALTVLGVTGISGVSSIIQNIQFKRKMKDFRKFINKQVDDLYFEYVCRQFANHNETEAFDLVYRNATGEDLVF